MGVEGMPREVLLSALKKAGATFLGEEANPSASEKITKADLYALGLSGRSDSAQRRMDLLRKLDLPEHLNTNALLDIFNLLYTAEEIKKLIE